MRTHRFCVKCGLTEDFCLCSTVKAGYKFQQTPLTLSPAVHWRDENQAEFYASVEAFDAAVRLMSGKEQQNQVDGECFELGRMWRLPPVSKSIITPEN